jgi:hypothetical protein
MIGNEGWVCPDCGQCNAPWVDACDHRMRVRSVDTTMAPLSDRSSNPLEGNCVHCFCGVTTGGKVCCKCGKTEHSNITYWSKPQWFSSYTGSEPILFGGGIEGI